MGYSIEIYFDNPFEEKIQFLWDQLAGAGVPSLFQKIGSRPHISLVLLESCIEEQVSGLIGEYFTAFPKISFEFSAVALIPGKLQTVFLVPAGNGDLLKWQGNLFRILKDNGYSPLSRYQPGKWLPHCSLSKELSASEALTTIEICQNFGEFGKARAVEAGFIKFRPRKEIKKFPMV